MMSLKKVVLARRSTVQLDNTLSAAQLLKASYLNNHHSFHFLLSLDSKHSFMGSTPERLYSRVGHELHTEALAGTIGRGDNATHDMELANWLSQDSKKLKRKPVRRGRYRGTPFSSFRNGRSRNRTEIGAFT